MSALRFVLPPPAKACIPKTAVIVTAATHSVARLSFFFMYLPPSRWVDRRYGRRGGSDLERLRELDAVAVRVEDVDDPHLAGELDHRADPDPLVSEAVGLRLDVVDIDHRDAALRVGLARGEGDVHAAA